MWITNFFKNLFKDKNTPMPNGLVPSPIDYRDIPLSAVSTGVNPTPASYQIPYKLTIKNQGIKPYCVAYAGTTIKEYLERRQGNIIEFDPDWLYKQCKLIDGLMPGQEGTTFRAMLLVLKNVGCLPLGGDTNDLKTIAKYRIAGYAYVNCDFNSIKRAIYEFGAILIGFVGSNGGWQTAYIRIPKPGEVTWGHATTGIAFDVTYVNGQNSWGDQWGSGGLFQFLQTYTPFEVWAVISDLPDNWQDLLPQPNDKPKYTFTVNLLPGYNNADVKALQDCLKWLGCMAKTQTSTSYYGPITVAAVKIFQGRYGILQTGNVGPLTIQKLNDLFQ